MIWTQDLYWDQSKVSTWAGNMRYADAQKNDRDPGGNPRKRFMGPTYDIRGAHGEQACSIRLNQYWDTSIGRLGNPDVGPWTQCRSVDKPHYCLRVEPKDADHEPFVLMRCQGSNLLHWELVGWMYARDVKRRFPLNAMGVHFAPPDKLEPMEELAELLLQWGHERLARERALAARVLAPALGDQAILEMKHRLDHDRGEALVGERGERAGERAPARRNGAQEDQPSLFTF